MSDGSKIEWTDASWPVTVGCDHVSEGCDNCYAATLTSGRLRHLPEYAGLAENGRFNGVVRCLPERLDWPLKWRKPRRIFVCSMSDLFHESVPDEFIGRVWQIMGAAPQHTYQILTKRHARMRSWVNRWYAGEIPEPYDERPVPGFPGYRVNTLGQVFGRRADTRAGLAYEIGKQGHRRVTMHREGSPRSGERMLVHRLVLTVFARSPQANEQACHRNGDPSDNRLSNLYWGTQADNWRDRIKHGNGRSHHKLTEPQVAQIRARCAVGESAYAVAKDYGVSDTQVRNIAAGRQWSTETPAPRATAPARVVLDSVWLGVSAEDQKWAAIRVHALLATPAAVRWVSAEPLLGPVDLRNLQVRPNVFIDALCGDVKTARGEIYAACPGSISWVVAGGESGANARPMHSDWARSLRDQCQQTRTPYLFKQWGEWRPLLNGEYPPPARTTTVQNPGDHVAKIMTRVGKHAAGRTLDGREWDQYPGIEQGAAA